MTDVRNAAYCSSLQCQHRTVLQQHWAGASLPTTYSTWTFHQDAISNYDETVLAESNELNVPQQVIKVNAGTALWQGALPTIL